MTRSKRTVVARDLFVSGSNVATATLIAYSLGEPMVWPFGACVAAVGVALFAAADRTDAGVWGFTAWLVGGILTLAAVLWWLVPNAPDGVLPPLLFGLGVGTAVNRLLFGVVYPLPEQRRQRENVA